METQNEKKSFLGFQSLTVAIILVWGLVITLVAATGFFIFKNKSKPNSTSVEEEKGQPISEAVSKNLPTVVPGASGEIPDTVACARFTSLTEALKNIDKACTLDLSGQNLTTVPDDITKLTRLKDINLSNNKISIFPSMLLTMNTLNSINLTNNSISSIPGTIKIPSNIKTLLLIENNLSGSDLEKYQIIFGSSPSPITAQNKK